LAAANFTVQPHDATGSAARSAIDFYFRALMAQVPGAQQGEAEPVHQLRVAARRLRAVVILFGPYIASSRPRATEAQLKWIGKEAGAVRDLDVLETLMHQRAKKLDSQIASKLEPLFEEVHMRRAQAAQNLAQVLGSRRFKSLVARLSGSIAITSRGDVAFGSVATGLYAPMLNSAARAGSKMHEAPTPAELHRLRKRAKRLRYALEMVSSIGDKHLADVIDALEELQDLLGRYHDTVVAVEWIKEFVSSRQLPSEIAFACGALAQAIALGERKLRRRGLKAWRRYLKCDSNRVVKKALEKVQPKAVSSQRNSSQGKSDDAVPHAPRPRRRSQS
jgi:CHAD domain-containing protein